MLSKYSLTQGVFGQGCLDCDESVSAKYLSVDSANRRNVPLFVQFLIFWPSYSARSSTTVLLFIQFIQRTSLSNL